MYSNIVYVFIRDTVFNMLYVIEQICTYIYMLFHVYIVTELKLTMYLVELRFHAVNVLEYVILILWLRNVYISR